MPTETRAVIDQILEANNKGDMETMVELTHPDCVITEPETLPYGGKYHGKQAFAELFGDVLATWETFEFEPQQVAVEGDSAFIRFDLSVATSEGDSTRTGLVEVYQIEDGLVNSVDIFYQDTAKLIDLLERGK